MIEKTKYNLDSGNLPSHHGRNPYRVPDNYFETFDQRVRLKIDSKRNTRRLSLIVAVAAAAVIAGIAFVFLPAVEEPTPPKGTLVRIDSLSLTGSQITDQVLADEIIEIATSVDTLFLAIDESWSNPRMNEISDEAIAEFLLMNGISATELAIAAH